MARTLAIFLLVASLNAAATEPFDARVQRAEAIENTPAGQAYQDEMWPLVQPFISGLMDKCVNDYPKADLLSFVWVGNLTANGGLVDVVVQPETDISRCFMHGMERAPFPMPPKDYWVGGLPLTFHMRLHPMPP